MIKTPAENFTKIDRYLAALLVLLILALGVCRLKSGLSFWGDDHSAYISEGIAIAEGRFDEQTRINYFYHPTELPEEAENGRLVYAWGYPLQLAGVYKLFGFDRVRFSSVLYYKLPSLLCLALTGGVLYLFLKRRFSALSAFCGALWFCIHPSVILWINRLYSDLAFLFFSMLSLLLMECYSERVRDEKPPVAMAVFFALSLLFTYATRLNGPAVCGVVLLGHGIFLWKNRETGPRKLLLHMLPYLLFLLAAFGIEHFWLAPATGNAADIDGSNFRDYVVYYLSLIRDFFAKPYGPGFGWFGIAVMLLSALGILTNGVRENFHLSLLILGSLLVLVLLPYHQVMRYLLNLFPLMILFALYGLRFLLGRLPIEKLPGKARKVLALAFALLLTAYPLGSAAAESLQERKTRDIPAFNDVYSPEAVEIYRYLQENTPEDAIICFCKPRSLTLNTERLAFKVDRNGHVLQDADYYLLNKREDLDYDLIGKTEIPMDLILENEGFALYSIRKG